MEIQKPLLQCDQTPRLGLDFKWCLLLQEAKEDAEMDAEIALEMAMEQQQRRSSMASSHSSVEGTYVGPCPHSPGQVGRNTIIIISSTRAFI